MDEQLTQLKAGLADLKDALSQAVTRIDAKLSALQNNNPDLSEEIQDVRDDIAVVQGLAADQTPAAAPTATTATDAAAASKNTTHKRPTNQNFKRDASVVCASVRPYGALVAHP
jgi:septal ring factor EnvC (AmiA/AmiB activator)